MNPAGIEFADIALRLALAVLAGLALGFDRGEHGKPAGMRTSILVCMAAAMAMLAANALLPTAGKRPDSFVTMDVMRLPLGILSGMGFIGAGAILKRGEAVAGLTTAASLWFITVVGICFGAGLLGLGLISLALGLAILSGVRWVEKRIPTFQRARLTVTLADGTSPIEDLVATVDDTKLRMRSWTRSVASPDTERIEFEVLWRRMAEPRPPDFVVRLARTHGVLDIKWEDA